MKMGAFAIRQSPLQSWVFSANELQIYSRGAGSEKAGLQGSSIAADTWLKDSARTWKDGLDIAETAAHLLEAAELAPMRIPPTWEVEKLRNGDVDLKALKELIVKFKDQLEPFRLPQRQNN